jgi:hypothetical protein
MTEEEDPFADLEETVSQDDESEPDATTTDSTMSTQQSNTDAQEPTDPLEAPAFDYDDDVDQSSFYARSETWDAFDTTLTKIELAAKEQGAKNVTKREIYDAILREVDVEAVAEAVVEEREK